MKMKEIKYMYKVRKRDGKIVAFDIKKISEAITKAFEAEDKIMMRILLIFGFESYSRI